MAPNLNYTAGTSTIVLALRHLAEKSSSNSFHPALKYTWDISETSIAFLDIKVSINGKGLSTSVHYKPTVSHSYLLHSSSHPSHVKNSIAFSQFFRLRRLCSDDSDFSNKSEEMCHFLEFKNSKPLLRH